MKTQHGWFQRGLLVAALGGFTGVQSAAADWSKADFTVEAIQLAPTTLAPGAALGATVTVRNRGDKAGDAGLLRVWVSHASPVTAGEAGSAEVAAGLLAPGEGRTLTFMGLAAPATAGTHQFRACVDADNVTPEYSWGDNQLPVTYTVDSSIPVAPMPSSIHYVAEGNAGAQSPYTNWTTAATCIQDAVSVATDGDTVLVTNGIYLLTSEIELARVIEVRSVNGAAATRVDGQGVTGCFFITTNAVVDGFTIQGGTGHLFGPGDNQGGGVCCRGGGEVRNCTIENNTAMNGGGVSCSEGDVVQNCLIRNNSAQGGGGVQCEGGALLNCIIQGNTAFDVGGVSCFNNALVRNCLIRGNSSYWCGGILVDSGARVENCTVTGNDSSGFGGAMFIEATASAVLNTIIYDNTLGAFAVGVLGGAGGTGTFDVQLPTPSARGTHHLRAYVVSPETEWSTGDNQLAITYGIQPVQANISVEPNIGVVVTWNNYWGDTYTVYRKAGLSGTFEPLATDLPSTRPAMQNVFIDTDPPAGGAFYKVRASGW